MSAGRGVPTFASPSREPPSGSIPRLLVNARLLSLLWRIVVALAGLLLVVGGLALLAHSLDAAGPMRAAIGDGLTLGLDLSALPLRQRWVWAAAALALTLTGVLLVALAVAQTSDQRERSQRVRLTGHSRNGLYGSGEVTVSMRSLYALVVHTAERDPSVREASPTLKLKRGGWHVGCRLVVTPDSEIPAVATRLKPVLADTLERHTGIPVVRTDLDVQHFSLDARTRVH